MLLNVHLHCLVLDGVYRTPGAVPVFHPVRVPTTVQLQTLLNQIIKPVMKLLTRQGYLVEEQDIIFMAETNTGERRDRRRERQHKEVLAGQRAEQGERSEADAMAPLQSAACTYRIALGPRAGQKVLTLRSVPRFDAQHTQQRCANEQGFSLHAEVRCAMNQRHKLEQLCRSITRPAIANERLKLNSAGDVVLQLKSPYQAAPPTS